jgi:hypothetical protein
MGGKTFKTSTGALRSIRIPAAWYSIVVEKVILPLKKRSWLMVIPREIAGKETFGDIDILYIPRPDVDICKEIKELFGIQAPEDIALNGDVTSFLFDLSVIGQEGKFQIDLIKTPAHFYDAAVFYFSFGDFGAILGMMAKRYGMTLGHDGLYIKAGKEIIDPSGTLGLAGQTEKVMLTSKPYEICAALGYDHSKYSELHAQPTYDVIFSWIMSSPLFSEQTIRNLVKNVDGEYIDRPMYRAFVAYAIEKFPQVRTPLTSEEQQAEDDTRREVRLKMQMKMLEQFGKMTEIDTIRASISVNKMTEIDAIRLRKERKEKFDGSVLISAFAVLGKKLKAQEIGHHIDAFKMSCCKSSGNDAWDQFVDAHKKEQLQTFVNMYATSVVTPTE